MPSTTNKSLSAQITKLLGDSRFGGHNEAVFKLFDNRQHIWNNSHMTRVVVCEKNAQELKREVSDYLKMCKFLRDLKSRKENYPSKRGDPLYRVLHNQNFTLEADIEFWERKLVAGFLKKKEKDKQGFIDFITYVKTYDIVLYHHKLVVEALVALQKGLSVK